MVRLDCPDSEAVGADYGAFDDEVLGFGEECGGYEGCFGVVP